MNFPLFNRASRTNKTTLKSRKSAAKACHFEPLEGRQLMSATIIVNTVLDKVDPASSKIVSLRDAINRADASKVATTVDFSTSVFNTTKTIDLTLGQLEVKASANISVVGPSHGLNISGNWSHGAFKIDAKGTLSLRHVTIEDCATSAAISNYGVLGLTDTTVSANNAGGLYNGSGAAAVILRSTFSGNYTSSKGGAIYNYGGTVTLINSTIANNVAESWGGGIENTNGTLKLYNATIDGNEGFYCGGGVDSTGTYKNFVVNTIIAGNTCDGTDYGPDIYGAVLSNGFNFIGAKDNSSGWYASDQTGTAASPIDPNLGSLELNGGLTENMYPFAFSTCVDAGNNAGVPSGITTDQNSQPRFYNGTVDIGAVEYQGFV